jgi:alginate O-acetyltransferase complex protein AlgI
VLFNSLVFICGFLPLTLLGFFGLSRMLGQRAALGFLVLASLGFYGWWNPRYLWLIALSVCVNHAVGRGLARVRAQEGRRRLLLTVGVAFNLGLLGYYKYANFFVDTLNAVAGTHFDLERILLPLAISFFTFQQIAFIVDASRGKTAPSSFLEYCFLVAFFPHLIAGPIVQHGELLSQLRPEAFRPSARNLGLGATLFVAGLAKKVLIADPLAPWVSPVYDAGATLGAPDMAQAWVATVAYSFQLYFDFSGYSDMATGLARMFNFTFPQNFDSPYKANNIIDFWRRWHMSLSRFLREYLYFPLGGSRRGPVRRYVNLMLTMLLGGFWHGAGPGFVVWGGLNGLYLVLNHLWHALRGEDESGARRPWLWVELSGLATFVLVMLSRVFFRTPSLGEALEVLTGLSGRSAAGLGTLQGHMLPLALFALLWVAVRALPNTQQLLADDSPVTRPVQGVARLRFRLHPTWGLALAVLAVACLLSLQQVSEFLYFQF